MAFDRNDPRAVRLAARMGTFAGVTAGLAPGYVQGNVCILPRGFAGDFRTYCERNPKPCPLIGVSDPGNPRIPALGEDLDIRTDVPRYRVFRDGKPEGEVTDIRELWTADMVAFVIGCSFSFEEALIEAGVPLRYVAEGKNVAMYLSSIETEPAGPFRGPMAVSMRPLSAADAIRAIQITSRYPRAHGAPVHLGRPDLIGIADLDRPFAGDRIEVRPDELPVFWACGITPQAAVLAAKPPICVTHAPGHMLVTDRKNSAWALP
ncbi:MAG TPA: putative hydro-lyase [Burkholderiales bacterium]|nr:putative hydro-lyase [Burkholderiales bacterium]